MEKTIKDVFNLIKKEILKDVYLKREKPEVFHFFRKNKRLQSEIIQDENILLLSIIYRFGDYGSICWNESENCKKIIKLHKIISKRGSKFYGISLYELGLLADELIEKNGKYSNLINNLKYCEHKYKESQSIENLKNLIIANMKLKRKSKSAKYIKTIKKYYIKESSSIYVYLILKSRFFISLVDVPYNNKIKKSIVDKLDLEELIELFEKKEEENELLGICDHVIFLETWIKILKLFFRKRSFEGKLFKIRNIKNAAIAPRNRYIICGS